MVKLASFSGFSEEPENEANVCKVLKSTLGTLWACPPQSLTTPRSICTLCMWGLLCTCVHLSKCVLIRIWSYRWVLKVATVLAHRSLRQKGRLVWAHQVPLNPPLGSSPAFYSVCYQKVGEEPAFWSRNSNSWQCHCSIRPKGKLTNLTLDRQRHQLDFQCPCDLP